MKVTAGSLPILAITQGDPAGVGPEILLKLLQGLDGERTFAPLVIAERAALEAQRSWLESDWPRLRYRDRLPERDEILAEPGFCVLDPCGEARSMTPGRPGPADARAAVAALDAGIAAVSAGTADALVTCPVGKEPIARHVLPDFRGHTDYLASRAGLERYGRDYLMAFLGGKLRVALLSTHVPLRRALDEVTGERVIEAVSLLARELGPELGTLAVAGLNPHAGEGGLLGDEERLILAPAIAECRSRGIPVVGPESPDTVFVRAHRAEFDWVLALYHDQGLIAVKSMSFGSATNWTLGLPYLRTSVDHGTAYGLAGSGRADASPLAAVVATTVELLSSRRDRRARPGSSSAGS